MPELRLFKRRWHLSTDTLPVMMLLLCITHVVWFIPYATGYWSVESTGLLYNCPQATLLRIANYSLFPLFGLAAINEAVIFCLGLRGGPFETRKRRHVTPLLYLEMVLWVLLLSFTIYATVVTYSGLVQSSCWTNNPCQYADKIPVACRSKDGSGVAQLTPACQRVVDLDAPQNCWNLWIIYGLNWIANAKGVLDGYQRSIEAEYGMTVDQLEALGDPPPGFNETINRLSQEFVDTYLNSTQDVTKLCGQPVLNNTYWQAELGFSYNDTTSRSAGNMIVTGVDGKNFSGPAEYNQFLERHPNVFAYINNELIDALEANTNLTVRVNDGSEFANSTLGKLNLARSTSMPWIYCLSETCQSWLGDADDCSECAQILMLPNPVDRKRFFEILVITSWAVLGTTGLVFWLCFNAFPSYDDVDSWEGTIKNLSSLCCMGGMMAESANVGGSDLKVSKEIAKSLNLLFGGIDMDPTDRLLGVYLVSERQHRRREADVLSALQDAGYVMGRRRSKLSSAIDKITPRVARRGSTSRRMTSASTDTRSLASQTDRSTQGGKRLASVQEDSAEAPDAVPLQPAAAPSAATANGAPSIQPPVASNGGTLSGQLPPSPFDSAPLKPQPVQLPPSPFETGAPRGGVAPQSAGRRTTQELAGGGGRLMLYQHSMLRLRSSVARLALGSKRHAAAAGLAAVEEGRSGRSTGTGGSAPSTAAEPEPVLEAAKGGDGKGGDGGTSGDLSYVGSSGEPMQLSGNWQNTAIRVTSRFHPLLTPSGCAGGSHLADPPLSPQAAADIYAGQLEAVSFDTLRESQRISKFAVAAYGLQGVIWAKGQRPTMCLANANRLVKCFKKPFGLDSKFRKRNFDTIIEMTGVAPSDLLYVSYTNVAGGVLPYLIMLHRPSKSVVLSVRGTVSMEDLITDLLSNPVDVGEWVPEWVQEEAAARARMGTAGDATGASLKAHIGIVSSATAILEDMEDRGLLRELLLSRLLRTATLTGRGTQDVITEFMATYQSQAIPALPKRPGSPGDAPVQAPSMARAAAGAEAPPVAAAAAAAGLPAVAEAQEGDGDETAAPAFQASEAKLFQRLATLAGDSEVTLPLERAQTIIRSKLQLQGWKVVVTGHSLGAAVACMLGMQLRDRFSDLQCWAFNPPGGLLSWELSQIAQSYCTSIVVGKDLISRLSFNTSKRVVDEMVVSLARCTRPKLKVFLDMLLGRRKAAETTPPTFCSFADVCPEALALVEGYYRTSWLHMQAADTTEMYPPGKLVFLRPFKGRRKRQTVWDAVWIDAASLISEGILLAPSMMQHHRLFVLADAFQSIFAEEAATQAAAQHEQGDEDLLGVGHMAALA